MSQSLLLSLSSLPNSMILTPSSSPNFSSPPPKLFPISKQCLQVTRVQSLVAHPLLKPNSDRKRVHEIEIGVRDYELDQFGVVNNAVYSNYCQHGCHELLKDYTSFDVDRITGSGCALARSEMSFKYIVPLKSGDRFVLKTKIVGLSKTRVFTEQVIVRLPDMEVMLEARGIGVWLNKNNRPVRIPPLLMAELTKLCYYNVPTSIN